MGIAIVQAGIGEVGSLCVVASVEGLGGRFQRPVQMCVNGIGVHSEGPLVIAQRGAGSRLVGVVLLFHLCQRAVVAVSHQGGRRSVVVEGGIDGTV